MADFSHLKQFDVGQQTARYTFDISICGVSPTLIVKPATEANKPYLNHLLKTAGKLKRGKVNAETIRQNREDDRIAYPKHIIVGWENVIGSDGEEVPFSKKACQEFIAFLPDWLFDEVRGWCGTSANFLDTVDIEDLAKN